MCSGSQVEVIMQQVAKLFNNGNSQAVRLPMMYRFDTSEVKEVFIRQDARTGDVILSRKPTTWDGFFEVLKEATVPAEFLSPTERHPAGVLPTQNRDPFEGWKE
jgi:antitoxin VapB